MGATFLAQFPTYSKDIIGGNEQLVTLFLSVFTIGVGIGSLLCNQLLKGEVEATFVPLGIIGVTVFTVDLYFASQHIFTNVERRADWCRRISFSYLELAHSG